MFCLESNSHTAGGILLVNSSISAPPNSHLCLCNAVVHPAMRRGGLVHPIVNPLDTASRATAQTANTKMFIMCYHNFLWFASFRFSGTCLRVSKRAATPASSAKFRAADTLLQTSYTGRTLQSILAAVAANRTSTVTPGGQCQIGFVAHELKSGIVNVLKVWAVIPAFPLLQGP